MNHQVSTTFHQNAKDPSFPRKNRPSPGWPNLVKIKGIVSESPYSGFSLLGEESRPKVEVSAVLLKVLFSRTAKKP